MARPAFQPRWLATVAAAVLALSGSSLADNQRWYIIELSGQPAGWMTSNWSTAEGLITSESKMLIKMARGASALEISMEGNFVETEAGEPVSMRSVQNMAGMPTTVEYTFGPDGITLVSNNGGQELTSTLPLPQGEWMTPMAASRWTVEQLKDEPETITLRTITPLSGISVVEVSRTGFERTTLSVGGEDIPVVRCVSTASAAPGVQTIEYLDAEGVPVRTETNMGGLALTMMAASKTAALAAAEGGFQAPEMMISTFVRPDRPIPDARTAARASFTLSLPDGQMPELPTTGAQRVEVLGPSRVRVTVNAGDPAAAAEGDLEDPAYRAASIMINGDDPRIRQLAERATKDAPDDPAERAEAMRRFVHKHIRRKSLDVGFASASEVARTRQGDCSEHGALLAAMLRADGVPARVVSGLLYVDAFEGAEEIFGYHMWTQALLPVNGQPTWIDLDATLPDATPFDATHIALGVSPLSDGELQDAFVAIAPLLGRLSIQVESVE